MRAIIKSRQDYLNKDSLEYIQTSWETIYENMLGRNASEEQLREVASYYNVFRKESGRYLVDGQSGMQNMMVLIQQKQQSNRK